MNGLEKLGVNPQRLQKAIEQATPYAESVSTKQDAVGILKKIGVNRETIRKAKKLLDNPFAPAIAKMAGVDLTAVRDGISQLSDENQAESTLPTFESNVNHKSYSTASNDVAGLKAALSRIKR